MNRQISEANARVKRMFPVALYIKGIRLWLYGKAHNCVYSKLPLRKFRSRLLTNLANRLGNIDTQKYNAIQKLMNTRFLVASVKEIAIEQNEGKALGNYLGKIGNTHDLQFEVYGKPKASLSDLDKSIADLNSKMGNSTNGL